MKKLLLFLFGAFLLSASVSARTLVQLIVCPIEEHDQPGGNGHPKSPDETPTVYIEDYTLFFETNHPEYVLNIKDEDGDTVYITSHFLQTPWLCLEQF